MDLMLANFKSSQFSSQTIQCKRNPRLKQHKIKNVKHKNWSVGYEFQIITIFITKQYNTKEIKIWYLEKQCKT